MKYLFVLLLVLTGSLASAQTAEDSVRATINNLFEGMKNADPSAIKNVFADSAILQTIINGSNGKITVRTEPVTAFENSISKLAKGAADERIEFGSVKVDGALASVWTPYKFYYNGTFSHCGANSFQLIRINGSWKIQYLIDTRRRQGCN